MKKNRFTYDSLAGISKEDKNSGTSKEQKENIEKLAEEYISTVFGEEFVPENVENLKSKQLEYSNEPPKRIKYEIEKERNLKEKSKKDKN